MSQTHAPESPELALLARITQLVGPSSKPEGALAPVVTLVKESLGTDVCSVYLLDPSQTELVLAATDGLAPGAVGTVRMAPGDGLTGLVAEVRAPVAVAEAFRHPRFRYFPETGEERYQSFLGVPLLRRGEVEGVLVVQMREARNFRRDEVRVLAAVASQLAGILVEDGARVAPARARELPRGLVFPASAAMIRDASEAAEALPMRPQVLVASANLGIDALREIGEATPGTVLLVPCELSEVETIGAGLGDVARRSPLRVAPAGATEPGDLARARRALLAAAGAGADVGLGSTVDVAATALSLRALAAHADFFHFQTAALARSATGGRSADPFLPAILRMIARAMHGARESGRPTFLEGGLGSCPEGWLAGAGFGADVLVAPFSMLGELRAFGRRLVPGTATDAARAALRTHTAADALKRLHDALPDVTDRAS